MDPVSLANEGELVRRLVGGAEEHVVIVAPFIKKSALERCLAPIRPGVRVEVFTRWRADEILAGVSDLSVWELLRDSPVSSLSLRHDLHAKVYCSETSCIVGSANVTGRALGWAAAPNLELLTECSLEAPRLTQFFESLRSASTMVNDAVYQRMRELVDRYALQVPVCLTAEETPAWNETGDEPLGISIWVPTLRQPEDLYHAYAGEADVLSSQVRAAALADLSILEVPPHLPREAFNDAVAIALLQMPIVALIEAAISTGAQRFGAVTDLLQTQLGIERDEAAVVWQALMRWLLHFLQERYERRVDRHTEMFMARR